eukprot:m.240536 g.240536  ORF g.240536 m.240536 type:complete len:378 (+) comp15380_c0_seq1:199-1332(+)
MTDYITQQLTTREENDVEAWEKVDTLFSRKLWHQLSIEIVNIVEQQEFEKGSLLELHNNFISTFVDKINPMTYAKLCLHISTDCDSAEGAIAFLEGCKERMASNDLAVVVLLAATAELLLKSQNNEEAKAKLKETDKLLQKQAGVTEGHQHYYRVAAEYYKSQGIFHEFYSNSLRYLGCIELSTLSIDHQVALAYDLSLAAVLGKGVYNFGDLLSHPVLESIRGTDKEWLIDLLEAFNTGDLSKFEFLQPQWSADPDLQSNEAIMQSKIRLLALMEMAFKAPASDRRLPFEKIAEDTKTPINQVEVLVMKALSLTLIRGSLDEVDSVVNVDWVKPRVLGKEQVETMLNRFKNWTDNVTNMADHMQTSAPDLFLKSNN